MKLQVEEIVNLLYESVSNRSYDMVPTAKNRNSRRKYGLTILDIENFLKTIEIGDLFKGPEPDRDVSGEEVFIFKKEIMEGVSFYVKVKKDSTVSYDRAKILSCHEDEN